MSSVTEKDSTGGQLSAFARENLSFLIYLVSTSVLLRAVPPQDIDAAHVYAGWKPGLCRYRLRSMVCFYGAHYQAFVASADRSSAGTGAWSVFDDARVAFVGAWADVVRKCHLGRIQPSVLLFEALGG